MYQLTRLQYVEKDYEFGGQTETVLIELYIDYKTYILNKIGWTDYAYVKEYFYDELKDNIFILPYDYDDECVYGKNPDSIDSWSIESCCYTEDCLTEHDIMFQKN